MKQQAGTFCLKWVILFFIAVSTIGAQDNTAEEGDPQQQNQSSLEAAYQREFIFLNNEIRVLQDRLEEVVSEGNEDVEAARERLKSLEKDYLEVKNLADQRREELQLLEEASRETRSADDIVEQVLQQADSRLAEFNKTLPELPAGNSETSDGESKAQQLQSAWDISFETLRQTSSVHQQEGSFFLEDGTMVDGTIINIGRIASFGISGEDGGTLAPAGDGALRIIERSSAETAVKIEEQGIGSVPLLPLFIYDSLKELIERDEGKSIQDTIKASGAIGMVIIVIGIISFILIIIRMLILWSISRGSSEKVDGAIKLVKKRDFEGALDRAKAIPGAMGRVLSKTILGVQNNADKIEDVISEAVLNEQPVLDRFRTVLGVFAAIAPLLGLLGTVTGMITTFDVITQFGTGDPKLLSGGISEALITTEFGLIVAIPTLLAGNLLSTWADRITSGLEISSLRVVNIVNKRKNIPTEEEETA